MPKEKQTARSPRERRTPLDRGVPIDLSLLPAGDGDCFGQAHDSRASECSMCHDMDLCAISFSERVKARAKELEQAQGPYLDMQDFGLVDIEALRTWLSVKERSAEDFVGRVRGESRAADDVALLTFIRGTLMPMLGVKVKGGRVVPC